MHKDEMIQVRVNSGHLGVWKNLAAAEGRSLSEWLRWLADRRASELAGGEPIGVRQGGSGQ